MKEVNLNLSISALCRLLGYSRQSFYKSINRQNIIEQQNGVVLNAIALIREDQPKIGTRKLRHILQDQLIKQGISLGRDRWFDLLRDNNLLIKQKKKYRPKMTDGNGCSIYPDFRKDLIINRPNQLWSGDITYLDLSTHENHAYAILIIDEYSHLIVGFYVSIRMRAIDTLQALQMATTNQRQGNLRFGNGLMFHSDRGSQFKAAIFREHLQKYEIIQSMTQDGMSYENPVSERINGIIKNELLLGPVFNSLEEAKMSIARAIDIYNTKRPHLSCNMQTPEYTHANSQGPLKKLWRPRKPKPPKDT